MTELLILFFIISSMVLAYKSYQDGVKFGAEKALNVLHEQKIICFDNKGNIKPNPFFDHDSWVNVEEEL